MELIKSANQVYEKLYVSILENGYPLLDVIDSLFYDVLGNNEIGDINAKFLTFFGYLTFSFIVIIVAVSTFKNLLSSIENKEKENIFLTLLKIAIMFIIANNSKFIIDNFLDIFRLLKDLINEFSISIINKEVSFKNLVDLLTKFKITNNDFFTVEGVINMAICYGSINLIISMAVKYVYFNILIIISPLALLWFYSNTTKKITVNWFKQLIYCILSQLLIKIILFFPLMYQKDDIIIRIIVIGVLYILQRIDNYIKELIL